MTSGHGLPAEAGEAPEVAIGADECGAGLYRQRGQIGVRDEVAVHIGPLQSASKSRTCSRPGFSSTALGRPRSDPRNAKA